MDTATELVAREKEFWTAAADFHGRWLASDALLVFPPPVGILNRDAALAGLRASPRWASVEMTDVSVCPLSDTTFVLSYRARARRAESSAEYVALIGSIYLRQAGEWKLAFHQHTPA